MNIPICRSIECRCNTTRFYVGDRYKARTSLLCEPGHHTQQYHKPNQPNPILNSRMFPAVPALLLVALSCCKSVMFYFMNSSLTHSCRFSNTSRRATDRQLTADRQHPAHRQHIAKQHIASRGRIDETHSSSNRIQMSRCGRFLPHPRILHPVHRVLQQPASHAQLPAWSAFQPGLTCV